HWSLVTGHWSLVTGHWSLVTGHWSLVTGHWSLVTGHWSLVTGHWSRHNSIYRANTLSHTSEAAGGISVCGLAAFKSFFPSHHPGSVLGENKICKRSFL
ncbi:MAG: hypothetical protein IJW57_00950, partial [Spirochaetaceae bacterium]|nr:hypothetical protein [Spirochaetaceae bacterium]